jgi:cell division septation protein DedD
MKIDIPATICELLYTHPVVILPGLGAFEASYKPAVVDHVQGKMYPPAKSFQFNENLITDDGLLQEQVEQRYQVSAQEAREAIENYVSELAKALERREIVEITGLGRLYLDFEQQFKFLQNSQNFNTDSFGIPSVQFTPIVRPRTETEVKAPPPKKTPEQPSPRKPKAGGVWAQRTLLLIIVASVVLIAISAFYMRREYVRQQMIIEPAINTPSDRINQSPSRNSSDRGAIVLDESQVEALLNKEGDPTEPMVEDEADDSPSEAPTLAPGTKEAIVIIGAFNDPDNATELVQRLFQAGYDAYSDKKGKSTRVGVQFVYAERRELDRKLERIRKDFNPKAWILQAE